MRQPWAVLISENSTVGPEAPGTFSRTPAVSRSSAGMWNSAAFRSGVTLGSAFGERLAPRLRAQHRFTRLWNPTTLGRNGHVGGKESTWEPSTR
jgi:hypothetical protein